MTKITARIVPITQESWAIAAFRSLPVYVQHALYSPLITASNYAGDKLRMGCFELGMVEKSIAKRAGVHGAILARTLVHSYATLGAGWLVPAPSRNPPPSIDPNAFYDAVLFGDGDRWVIPGSCLSAKPYTYWEPTVWQ